MSNNHQIEAHIYFGKILRGWDAYEGYKYFHPDTKLTEEEYYSFVENLRYKPGRIVPAAGTNTTAEVFNAACQTDPEDANESKPGRYSHAENIDTFAGGEGSHAEGIGTRAMGYGAHAEGANTEVKGSAKFGHVGGNGSTVEAEAGFAHGVNAVSKNRGEAVFGKNNDPDTTGKSMFQVGIGPNKNNPKTGFQIDSDGTIWVINTNTGSRISLQSWLNDIQLKKIVVDQLPEAGAPSTVYLLRVTAPDESRHNFFEEYIYIDGAWEMLGTSDTDESIIERILSNPAFKVDSQQIADKAIQTKHLSDGCVTADAIQDGAIGNEKIASKTITHDKIADGAITYDLLAKDTKDVLGDIRADLNSEIQERINGDQSIREQLDSILDRTVQTTPQELTETQQEQAFENLGIKTVFVDSATEIGVALSEERANEIGSALRVVLNYPGVGRLVFSIGLSSAEDYEFYTCASPGYLYNARLNKKSRILRILTLSYLDSTAVKYYPQKLTEEQQEQAFENLGIKTVFVDYETEIGVVLSEERIAEIISANQIVIETPEMGKLVLPRTNLDSTFCYFQLLYAANKVYRITVIRAQRTLSIHTYQLSDDYSVKFAWAQYLSDNYKKIARANIGAMADTPSGDPMHHMYELAGAVWNASTGFWELNELTDLTTDEMQLIYQEAHLQGSGVDMPGYFAASNSRTNICLNSGSVTTSLERTFYARLQYVTVKVVRSGLLWCSNINQCFYQCRNLETVIGVIRIAFANAVPSTTFFECFKLKTISLQNLSQNVSFPDSPLLSLESLQYMVNNASNTSAITITVHADVYAKLTGDMTNAAAAALTPDELAQWMALVETAAEKNITFATA